MILVVGASGNLGGIVAQSLIAKGKKIRVLARSKESVASLAAKGAEVAIGDMKDRSTLDKALAGIDTVVTTANSALRGGSDTVETVDLAGNKNLIDAAKGAGVKHFIFTSSLGVQVGHPVPLFDAKARTEDYLKASGLTYTILQPNLFTEVWVGMVVGMPLSQGKPVTLVGSGTRKHSLISMADVAAFAVAAVDVPAAKNQTLYLGGPEAMSWRDVIGAFDQAFGKSTRVEWVAPGSAVPGLPDMMSGVLAAMETYDSPIDMSATAKAYNVKLSSVADFARGAARQ